MNQPMADTYQQLFLSSYRKPAGALSLERFSAEHGEAFLVYFGASSELRAPARSWQATRFDDGRKAGAEKQNRSASVQIFPVRYTGRSISDRWVTVGRAARTNDIPIVDESVSASHAVFERGRGGEFLLRDANSRTGTFVNDEQVGPDDPMTLKSGDSIRFGAVTVVFLQAPEFVQLVLQLS
ncbi:MAG: FHA domain-containing protein [Deltaproteobacteria bacterium]|nr:FHA domain-containing protein [Deltaproteobacteria bacterium]